MIYFTKEFTQFMEDLSVNNNTDWFHTNKKQFERHVKNPFGSFTKDLISELGKEEDLGNIQSKDCIFRINRDIRFSKDKSPYKTFVSFLISPYGRKNKTFPGLYLQISATEIRLYSGSHNLTNPQLKSIRQKIYDEQERFKDILSNNKFKETFGEIRGDKNINIPAPFSDIKGLIPEITNKAFYYFTMIPVKTMFQSDFMDIVLQKYKACNELNQFLKEALGS